MNEIPERACADCEADRGTLDRSDRRKSHGQCRRHFLRFVLSSGLTEEEAEREANNFSSDGFCPDLGDPENYRSQSAPTGSGNNDNEAQNQKGQTV